MHYVETEKARREGDSFVVYEYHMWGFETEKEANDKRSELFDEVMSNEKYGIYFGDVRPSIDSSALVYKFFPVGDEPIPDDYEPDDFYFIFERDELEFSFW